MSRISFSKCNECNKFSKKDCSYPIDYFESENGKYSNIINSLKKISIEKENLYLFDALSMMCPNNLCKYNLNGNLFKKFLSKNFFWIDGFVTIFFFVFLFLNKNFICKRNNSSNKSRLFDSINAFCV